MKTFLDIREKKLSSDKVVDKGKMKRISYEIRFDGKEYHAYIDGDYLDKFRKQPDAKKAIQLAIKELA
jgi:hypothetical protein